MDSEGPLPVVTLMKIVDHDRSVESRVQIAVDSPVFADCVVDAIGNLIDAMHAGTDKQAHNVIDGIISRIWLPMSLVYKIVYTFKTHAPERVSGILAMNIQNAIITYSYLGWFIGEYFETELSVSILAACLVSRLTGHYYALKDDRLSTLNFFTESPHREYVYKNRTKALELLSRVSKFLLEYHLIVHRVDKKNTDYITKFVQINRDFEPYFPYIRSLGPMDRVDIACAIHKRLLTLKHGDYRMDTYLRLYDNTYGLGENLAAGFTKDDELNLCQESEKFLAELDARAIEFKDREADLGLLYNDPKLVDFMRAIQVDTVDFYGRTLKEWLRIAFLWAKDDDWLMCLEDDLGKVRVSHAFGIFSRIVDAMSESVVNGEYSIYHLVKTKLVGRANALIRAQPDAEEILAALSTRGVMYADVAAKELMDHMGFDEWNMIADARWYFLHPE